MTPKDKILAVIKLLDDDATIDEVIYRLNLLRKIEIGIAQAESGDCMEHDEFMDQLQSEIIDQLESE